MAVFCSAKEAPTPASGWGRIDSQTSSVSNRIIAKPSIELSRFSHWLARRCVQLHAAQGRETRAYGLGKIGWWCGLTGERRAQDAARLFFHRVAVLGRPDAKLPLQCIVQFTNRDAGQDGSPLWVSINCKVIALRSQAASLRPGSMALFLPQGNSGLPLKASSTTGRAAVPGPIQPVTVDGPEETRSDNRVALELLRRADRPVFVLYDSVACRKLRISRLSPFRGDHPKLVL